jgi:DNA-binding response OmpR family regulator
MRILVLEDSAQIRDVIARALRRAGYVVSTASQGNEALAQISALRA